MFNVKNLARYECYSLYDQLTTRFSPNGEWVRYSDVLEMVVEALNSQRAAGSCPKCGSRNVVTAFMPTGAVYLVDRARGFKPYRPEDLSVDGQSVQATEEHLLHSCGCGWRWVEACKDAPLEVVSPH